MGALLTVDLVALALFAWFCLVKVVPDCNVSIYRYRLWRVRDRLDDQLREGLYEDGEAPRELLREVERLITCAPEVGIVKLVLAKWAMKGYQAKDMARRHYLASLPESDRQRLERLTEEVDSINARHIALGSPSGWVITALLLPLALGVTLAQNLRDHKDHRSILGQTRERVKHETTPPPGMFRDDTGTHSLTRAF